MNDLNAVRPLFIFMKLLKNHADSETSLGDQRSDTEQRHLSPVSGRATGLGGDRCLLNFQLFLHIETSVEKPEKEKCHTFYGWLHQKGESFATCSVDDQGEEMVCWMMFVTISVRVSGCPHQLRLLGPCIQRQVGFFFLVSLCSIHNVVIRESIFF